MEPVRITPPTPGRMLGKNPFPRRPVPVAVNPPPVVAVPVAVVREPEPEVVVEEVAVAPEPEPEPVPVPRAAASARAGVAQQEMMQFEPVTRGRFEKSEPTIVDGQDLDVPAYLRHQVKIR